MRRHVECRLERIGFGRIAVRVAGGDCRLRLTVRCKARGRMN